MTDHSAIANAVATVARATASIPREPIEALRAAVEADPGMLLDAGLELDQELRIIDAALELGDAVRAAE